MREACAARRRSYLMLNRVCVFAVAVVASVAYALLVFSVAEEEETASAGQRHPVPAGRILAEGQRE